MVTSQAAHIAVNYSPSYADYYAPLKFHALWNRERSWWMKNPTCRYIIQHHCSLLKRDHLRLNDYQSERNIQSVCKIKKKISFFIEYINCNIGNLKKKMILSIKDQDHLEFFIWYCFRDIIWYFVILMLTYVRINFVY